jgi:hypothetical protein
MRGLVGIVRDGLVAPVSLSEWDGVVLRQDGTARTQPLRMGLR